MATKNEIITAITAKFRGIAYSDCYVGITSNVQQRLFVEHNVPRATGRYIHRTADRASIAREVEQHFINAGMKGGGGGSRTARIVYSYKKVPWVTKQ